MASGYVTLEFSERLRSAMRASGMSAPQLADAAGVPYPTLQSYMSGRHKMTVQALAAIAKALGVTMDWLWLGRQGASDLDAVAYALRSIDRTNEMAEGSLGYVAKARFFQAAYSDFEDRKAQYTRTFDGDVVEIEVDLRDIKEAG